MQETKWISQHEQIRKQNAHARTHTHTHIRTHVRTHARTHTHTPHTHAHIHTTHTYTPHTHTHTHTHASLDPFLSNDNNLQHRMENDKAFNEIVLPLFFSLSFFSLFFFWGGGGWGGGGGLSPNLLFKGEQQPTTQKKKWTTLPCEGFRFAGNRKQVLIDFIPSSAPSFFRLLETCLPGVTCKACKQNQDVAKLRNRQTTGRQKVERPKSALLMFV